MITDATLVLFLYSSGSMKPVRTDQTKAGTISNRATMRSMSRKALKPEALSVRWDSIGLLILLVHLFSSVSKINTMQLSDRQSQIADLVLPES